SDAEHEVLRGPRYGQLGVDLGGEHGLRRAIPVEKYLAPVDDRDRSIVVGRGGGGSSGHSPIDHPDLLGHSSGKQVGLEDGAAGDLVIDAGVESSEVRNPLDVRRQVVAVAGEQV